MELAGWKSGRHMISVICTHFALHNLFILSDGRLENSFCPCSDKDALCISHSTHWQSGLRCACISVGFPMFGNDEGHPFSHQGQLRGFPLPGRGWRCFWRGQWSGTLFDLSCACEGRANRSLKPSQGQGFLPGLQVLQVSSVAHGLLPL